MHVNNVGWIDRLVEVGEPFAGFVEEFGRPTEHQEAPKPCMEGLDERSDDGLKSKALYPFVHPPTFVNLRCCEHLSTQEPNNGQDGRDDGERGCGFCQWLESSPHGCDHQVAKEEVEHVA